MRNRSWERWGSLGILFGIVLFVFGLLLQFLEISRIYRGPANRGSVDFLNKEQQWYNPSLLYFGDQFSEINQRHTMWPWSFPGLWLGVLACVAGFMGCVAARHRTYGSILGFAVLSFVTAIMSTFAIGYYSIIVNFYNKRNTSYKSEDLAKHISRTLLAFSVLLLPPAILAALLAGMAIKMFSPKGRSGPGMRYGPRGMPPRYPPPYGGRPPYMGRGIPRR